MKTEGYFILKKVRELLILLTPPLMEAVLHTCSAERRSLHFHLRYMDFDLFLVGSQSFKNLKS